MAFTASLPRFPILVCFALKQEATPLRRRPNPHRSRQILITGVGTRNAEAATGCWLKRHNARLVLTCGFAGALNPQWDVGTVLFAADENFPLTSRLLAANAHPARFHHTPRMLCTAAEKQALWRQTGADAVEMESEIIRHLCRKQALPSATVRVISDGAAEDLPLDFNRFLTANHTFNYAKLALTVIRAPGKGAALLKLHRQCQRAAVELARVLAAITAD